MDASQDAMASRSFEKDFVFDTVGFITEIESRPAIWDSSCVEFSNRVLRNKAWYSLVHKYGATLSKIERIELAQLLKKKWKSLRGCYRRELKRQSGLESYEYRKSKYIYFQKLNFLENVVSPSSGITNGDDKYLQSDEDSEESKEKVNTECPNTIRKLERTEMFENKSSGEYSNSINTIGFWRTNFMEIPNYLEKNFDTESFIAEMETRPALWDSTSAEYGDRFVNNRCWMELVDIYGSHLSVIEKRELGTQMKKRWRNIRACYARELKRKSGIGTDHRKSEYVYFSKLHFLERIVSPREVTGNGEDSTASEEDFEESNRKKRSRKQIGRNSESDSFIEEVKNEYTDSFIKQVKKEDSEIFLEDEDRLFLLSLLKPLKSVPESKRMSVKIKIMSLLDHATQNNDFEDKGPDI